MESPGVRQRFDRELERLQRRNWQVTERDDDLLTASLSKRVEIDPPLLLGRGEFRRKTDIVYERLQVWIDDTGEVQRQNVRSDEPLQR